VRIEEMEVHQALQEAVLSAYHLVSIAFDQSPATKLFISDHERMWIKNWEPPARPQ
jgi:hypothetical protein